MATKNDSVQEERIQNVSAPRAEPGPAAMIIPRRDLLTGAALVLVGSASGCDGSPQRLRTQFMTDFTAEFIGDPTTIKDPAPLPAVDSWPDPHRRWPGQNETQTDIVTDFGTFVNVLLTMGYVMGPPPAFPSGSLGARIVLFIQGKNWPTATTILTGSQNEPLPTVHLVEISVILDRLLQAMNSFNPQQGKGGGGSNWPPH
jgi:hypothetical protein